LSKKYRSMRRLQGTFLGFYSFKIIGQRVDGFSQIGV
jgi:hypothetical protein